MDSFTVTPPAAATSKSNRRWTPNSFMVTPPAAATSKSNSRWTPNSFMATPNSNSLRTPSSASSCSLLKQVFLYDWWLIKSDSCFNGKQLGIGGFNSRERQGVRVFHSAPIVKRHDTVTVETSDDITVILCGLINMSRTLENGFISEAICKHFIFGFPYDWEEFADISFVESSSSKDDDLFTNRAVNIEDLPATAIQDLFLMSSSTLEGLNFCYASKNQNEEKTTQADYAAVVSDATPSRKRKGHAHKGDDDDDDAVASAASKIVDRDVIINQTLEATPRDKNKDKGADHEEFEGIEDSTKGSALRRSSRLKGKVYS